MNRIEYYIFKAMKRLRLRAIKNSHVHPSSTVEAGSELVNCRIDRHSFCGYNCELVEVTVGAFCSIANHAIIGGGMHPIDWVSTSPVFYAGRDSIRKKYAVHRRFPQKKTVIGNDVWIGSRALIKQGVVIGHGAIVGMGSVVTRDVAPYSIVAGSPAREVRKRFSDETIAALLQTAWWDLSDRDLERLGPFATDVECFLSRLRELQK